MAPLIVLFIIIIGGASPLAQSRTTPPHHIPKTTILDVTASIQKTLQVLNFNQSKQQQQHLLSSTSSSSSSKLSLQLHSRASLQKPTHTHYKSLTLSRLERDSARVRTLLTRSRSFRVSEFEAPIISGTSQGSGEYFSRVGIGHPPTPAYMVLDTGSDISWVQCAPCQSCYRQSDPIFNPNTSSSFKPLSCASTHCQLLDQSQCRHGNCLYEVSYGDGSYTVGEFVTETVTIGQRSLTNIAIGCGHDNQGLFIGAAGLLGLGGGTLSFPAQLNSTTFSYCLVDRDSDSSSTLEFDAPLPHDAVTVPLRRNSEYETFYYVGLEGISVGDELFLIPEGLLESDPPWGGFVIDSGTAVTRLRREVYEMVRTAFVRGTEQLGAARAVSLFDTCYDLSSMSSVMVPTVSFHFEGGKVLTLDANNYLIPVDSVGTFCFAFISTNSPLSIIGNVQQQGTRVSFDLANSLIGFTPKSC
ncbi:hypothetical protein PIB30_030121 [Stylosanthes scabra]|uniref:Peptidase A1 domain-containing protein n=1 Tax=Stylosanthes scabra TaxID=79078 RepID=A0ABU6YC37_9FABA|nr:hypothetical protein [Stylosanthes scabra]